MALPRRVLSGWSDDDLSAEVNTDPLHAGSIFTSVPASMASPPSSRADGLVPVSGPEKRYLALARTDSRRMMRRLKMADWFRSTHGRQFMLRDSWEEKGHCVIGRP